MKLAPDIKSSDGKYRTIRVDGYSRSPESSHIRYQATYRAPGDFSLVMSDGVDGTPILYSTAREVLFHDPLRPTVIYAKSMNMYMDFSAKGDKMGLLVGANSSKPSTGVLHIDLKSAFNPADSVLFKDEVADTGDRTYRLTRIGDHGKKLVYCFDLKQSCPLTSIQAYSKGSQDPTFGLDRIVVDGPVNDDDFRFPDVERLARLVPVRDDSNGGLLRLVGDLSEIAKSFRVRDEAYHPAERPKGLRSLIHRVDWDQVKANDRKFAAAVETTLRIVPPTLPGLPAGRPAPGPAAAGSTNLDQGGR